MLGKLLENVRAKAPLIHNITNYVTVNDCANILLACGASPIMADDCGEVEEITALCDGLNINIGTLNARTIPAMELAGRRANALGRPVLLDPVGAGASALRTGTAASLLKTVRFAAIRGNVSEIKALCGAGGATKGVDADLSDRVTEENLDQALAFAQAFSRETGAVVVMTGAIDIVADGLRAYLCRNGDPMMSRVTGTGCMLSAMTTAYLAANPGQALEACLAAVCAMGLCGEIARERVRAADGGNARYRAELLDAVYRLSGDALEAGAQYQIS